MADNNYDSAGSTQMFRAFVDEAQAPQTQGSVSTYGSSSSNRTGVLVIGVIVALAVVAGVIWLAVK